MKHIEALPEYSSCISEYGIALWECQCLTFDTGETLIHQGTKGEFLYFIVDGIAKVQVYNPDGKTLSLSYSVSEGVLGEVELVSETDVSTAAVIAETDIVCLAYPYWRARMACNRDIRFMKQIAKDLAAKLSRSTNHYLAASFSSAESRMCAYLLREMEESVYRGTLAKAAVATGISYRHMQRVMIQLCKDGVMCKDADGYRVLDYDELDRRAHT